MLKWKLFRSRSLAITYFIIITILFCLPGSALPKENWFNRVGFDKVVHFCFFAALLFLWRTAYDKTLKNLTAVLLSFGFIYGILIEIIQTKWVPNRSFDLYDIVADAVGAVMGIFVWLRVYKKNKPL
jgi:VanZ family protein